MSENLRRISGHAKRSSAQQWRQLGTTAATVVTNFYCITAVGGNAVLSQLTARGNVDALAWIDSATKTLYEGQEYFGPYTKLRVSSGEVRIDLGD